MWPLIILFTNIVLFLNTICCCNYTSHFTVTYEWNYINFTWPSKNSQLNYVPESYVIAGIKIYKDIIYLALPRQKSQSRITLATLPLKSNKTNPLLTPYPNWEMNSGEDCHALQDVLSMDIDLNGVMWVLDARRVSNATRCPPRIVLFDLNHNGRILSDFIVPDYLCPHNNGCFLNDIVIDGNLAYISDTTASDPGIFVYDRVKNAAWKFRDRTMYGVKDAVNFVAQGVRNRNLGNINGVALAPDCGLDRRFYYMPQTSYHIFSISNRILRNYTLYYTIQDLREFIKDEGTKQGQSGGMMCDSFGNIYYGILPLDAVGKWNTSLPLSTAQIIDENHEIIKWPDSFSIHNKTLYLITNSILKFSTSNINLNEINFRIIKLNIGTRNYLYCK